MRTKTDVSFVSAGTQLAGTLTAPDGHGPYPTALILAGSGPIDRDGNAKHLALGVSKDLAEWLAINGWGSLRFDKRGIGESAGDYQSTGFYEELADAETALNWLKAQPKTGPIVIIGHSVGAIYAGELASRHPDLTGIVMLATSTKTGHETLVWQGHNLDAVVPAPAKFLMKLFRTSVAKQQAKNLDKLQATTTDVARIQFVKINAKWMREFMDHDPKLALHDAKVPLLAITGEKDIQVDDADLAEIAQINPDAAVHCLTDLDHILRHETAEISNPRKYKKQLQKPIDERVTGLVLDFLEELAG
ncbi:MAG: alpha/beta fold hydrolase [Acidimicrobiia bacterium]|nr:alpha/beta fold hydrolase [Acidimicrobiia bacterium]